MKRILVAALAGAAVATASPAFANDTLVSGDPCSAGFVTIGGQSALACVGFYGSNLLSQSKNDPTPANILADLNTLMTNTPNPPGVQSSTAGYSPPYTAADGTVLQVVSNLNGASSFNFGQTLSGVTLIGAHFGNGPGDVNNVTAFWLFNLTTPGTTVNFASGQGSSNAELFATGGTPLPEPATWAMMLVGFGGVGMAMRRRRQRKPALMQIA